MRALRQGALPPNISVHAFSFRAGSMKNVGSAQRGYISTNYTFVARDLLPRGVNVLVQLVTEREVDGQRMLSLPANTDVTLDLIGAHADAITYACQLRHTANASYREIPAGLGVDDRLTASLGGSAPSRWDSTAAARCS